MSYEQWFRLCFDKIIKEYGLKLVVLAEDQMGLIGKQYILVFTVHHGNLYVSYIYRQHKGCIVMLDIDRDFTQSIEERDLIDLPKKRETVKEEIQDFVLITARCLERRWSDLLRGEKEWMTDRGRIQGDLQPRPLGKVYAAVLSRYI